MKLKVVRETKTDISTIGSLFINDVFFCYTLEDKDRGLKQSDSLLFIQAKKIFGLTAILTSFNHGFHQRTIGFRIFFNK